MKCTECQHYEADKDRCNVGGDTSDPEVDLICLEAGDELPEEDGSQDGVVRP
jgi:hypothetical protein